jgi:hypothetical protein
MLLTKAHVRNYRSIIDTGVFEIEDLKTIMVGPNEAGKTVILQALQKINKPKDVPGFEALRDYPRSKYNNDISTGKVKVEDVKVATGYFKLEDKDKVLVPEAYHDCLYVLTVHIDNSYIHDLENAPKQVWYIDLKKNLARLCAHLDKRYEAQEGEVAKTPSETLSAVTETFTDYTLISSDNAIAMKGWLEKYFPLVDEDNKKEEERYDKLVSLCNSSEVRHKVLKTLEDRVPVFVYFNNYFRVKPSIHLEHLAERVERNILDDDYYDYGNLCLLKLLGFSPRELVFRPPNRSDSITVLNCNFNHVKTQIHHRGQA